MKGAIGVSGHRPERAGGRSPEIQEALTRLAMAALNHYVPSRVNVGMAEGWDQAVVDACCWLSVPFWAYIPFEGQEERWDPDAQATYRQMLRAADEVCVACKERVERAYLVRNRQIVDNSHRMVFLWDGVRSGGTWGTVEYAERSCVPSVNMWHSWVKYGPARKELA